MPSLPLRSSLTHVSALAPVLGAPRPRPSAGEMDRLGRLADESVHRRLSTVRQHGREFGDRSSASGVGSLSRRAPAAPPLVGNHSQPQTGARPPVIDRLPPQNLDSEQAVLGSILIDRDAIIEIADFLHPEDFYRQAHGRIFAAMLELFEQREPIDVVTVAEALERAGELEAIGGAELPLPARQRHPHRRPRRPVRPHRRAQGHPAPPHPGRRQDRRHRLRGRLGHPGVDRPVRGRAVRGQPAPLERRLQPPHGPPPRRLRPPRLPPHPPRRDRRHRLRLRGPGPAHDRLPAERPDRPGGPAQRRQDQPGPQHRRARRRARGQDGRRLQPGDEQGAAGPAPALQRRRHRLAAPPLGLPRGAGLRPHRPGHAGPFGRADLHRRHADRSAPWSCGPRPAASRPNTGWTC